MNFLYWFHIKKGFLVLGFKEFFFSDRKEQRNGLGKMGERKTGEDEERRRGGGERKGGVPARIQRGYREWSIIGGDCGALL